MTEIRVIIAGPVGCGKSAITGEIEIAMKAIGVPVRYEDKRGAQSEKNMTHADWTSYLEMYQPSVVLVEQIDRPLALFAQAPRDGGETQGGSATETEREPNAAVTAEIERGLARCSDPVRYAIRKEASDLIGLHAPGNRHLEQAVIAALLRRTAQSQKGTAR